MPSPTCNPLPLNFVLRFYRRCNGTTGCNNTCIRAGSPWVITISGQTVNVGSASASGGTSNICLGSNANLVSIGSNGTPPYNFLWNPGALVGQNQTVTPTSTTVYNVLITDACGSTATQNVTVNVTPNTNPNFTISPNPACVGDAITFTGLGTGNANSYDWLLPSSSSATLSNQQIPTGITYSTAGTFNATLNYQQGLCLFPITNQITINAIPAAPIISSNSPICLGETLNLEGPSIAGATYNWSGPSFSSAIEDPTINNVVNANSGAYNLTVTVNGCTSNASTLNVVINPTPPQPTITASGSLSICNGQNVILTSSAASSYLWSNGATTQSITVSAGGSYTVQVFNVEGCSSVLSIPTVVTLSSNPAQPSITASGPTTFCNGNSVTLTSSAENSYLWSNGATTQSITTTLAGNYSVIVSNSFGCSSVSSNVINITVNPGPGIPTITGGPLNFCQGGNVTLSAPPGFTYLWSNGNTAQNITLSNSANVTVTITDANGCSVSSATTIVTVNPLPVTPLIVASGATTFCAGNSVGLNAPSGFSYLWSNGETTQSISVSVSGNYSLQVTDANGCISNISNTIAVTVFPTPPTPIITASSNSICSGSSIVLSASNSLSYLWSNGSTTQDITVSSPGNYSLTSTDVNGCTSASSSVFSLTENPLPPTPAIVASGILNFCEGSSVTLTGPAGYTNYIWNSSTTNNQNNTITTSGIYTLQVTDANGCTSPESLPVEVIVYPIPSTPTILANGPVAFCDGGSVQLSVNDLNVTYLWSNGATTQTLFVDASGNFSVEITNQQGCVSSASAITTVVEFPIPPVPVITSLNGTSVCEGTTTNLVCSSAASYLWQPNGETTQSIDVGSAGNYSVSIIDNNGCASVMSLATTITLLPLPATPVITANGLTTFCFGNSVELSSSSAINNSWNSGETTQNITVTNSGDFYVVVLGANGCLSLPSNTIEVDVNSPPPPPAIVANGPLTFCDGNSVILSVTNSQSYLWSNGSIVQSQEFNQTEGITVDVLDVCGVPYTLQAQVTVLQQPIVLFDGIDTVGCVPLLTTFNNLSANYNEIFWDFGDGSSSAEINPLHTYSNAGKYTVSLVAISQEGCIGYYSKNLLIDALPVPIADFKTNPESKIKISKPNVEFTDLSEGNVNQWNWSMDGDIFSELQKPSYKFADTGSYNVKLWIKSVEGCEDTISKTVLINGDLILYVPNTFTPNNDGTNDVFLPLGTYINPKEYNLKIFDRWGQIVYETNDIFKGWDGDTGSGNVKHTQVYYWQLNVKDFAGESHYLSGSVSAIY
jgi:gliding motility-associated-like protein